MFIKLFMGPMVFVIKYRFQSKKLIFTHILLYQWIAIYTSIRSVKLIYA